MWAAITIASVAAFVVSAVSRYHDNLEKVCSIPGFRSPFGVFSLFGAILPTSYFNPGLDWQWAWRYTVYKYYRSRTISFVPLLMGMPMICTSSMAVAKQVLNGEQGLYKAPDSTAALMLWGDNVISSNYDVYRRHRKIVGPAFTGASIAMVARESVKLYHEMIDVERWDKQDEVVIEAINRYMQKFALAIITRCGFGLPFPWSNAGGNDRMSFEEALTIVSEGVIIRLATPRWAYQLPIKRLRVIDEAYRQLSAFMNDFVSTKKQELSLQTEGSEQRGHDLFTRLVSASEAEGKKGLGYEELIGNVFAFMFAGHETTAHTLSATIACLALYQDVQEKVYEHIREVLPDGRDPSFEDYPRLFKVTACFQEGVRMFPAGSIVTRDTTEAVTIELPPKDGGKTVIIQPGVRILIDMIGLHYDPSAFPDPERFDPERWYSIQEPDITMFGLGPRSCLGRKFAMTEATFLLTLILRDWKLSVCLQSGESKEQWRARVMQGGLIGLGFGIRDAPVRLTSRA